MSKVGCKGQLWGSPIRIKTRYIVLKIQAGFDCQLCLYVLSLNSYNWHNRVPKLMGVPLLTAEYHTQYIWLILLTKTYECSRHVTTPWYRCLLSSYLSSRPMAKPHPKPMSLTSVICSPDLVASTWYMVSSRPDLDADLLRCFIALVSSAPNPLWST